MKSILKSLFVPGYAPCMDGDSPNKRFLETSTAYYRRCKRFRNTQTFRDRYVKFKPKPAKKGRRFLGIDYDNPDTRFTFWVMFSVCIAAIILIIRVVTK